MKSRLLLINIFMLCIMLTSIPAYAAGDTGGGTLQTSNCDPLSDQNVMRQSMGSNAPQGVEGRVFGECGSEDVASYSYQLSSTKTILQFISDNAKASVHDINERINCFDNNVILRLDALLSRLGISVNSANQNGKADRAAQQAATKINVEALKGLGRGLGEMQILLDANRKTGPDANLPSACADIQGVAAAAGINSKGRAQKASAGTQFINEGDANSPYDAEMYRHKLAKEIDYPNIKDYVQVLLYPPSGVYEKNFPSGGGDALKVVSLAAELNAGSLTTQKIPDDVKKTTQGVEAETKQTQRAFRHAVIREVIMNDHALRIPLDKKVSDEVKEMLLERFNKDQGFVDMLTKPFRINRDLTNKSFQIPGGYLSKDGRFSELSYLRASAQSMAHNPEVIKAMVKGGEKNSLEALVYINSLMLLTQVMELEQAASYRRMVAEYIAKDMDDKINETQGLITPNVQPLKK